MSFNRSPIIGLALLSLASIWFTLFAERYLENIPKDFQYTADIISTDNFYDSERKDFDGAIFSKTNFFYQAVEEHGKSITIRNVFDVRTPEGDPIFSVDRLYGVDRKTGKQIMTDQQTCNT